MYDIKKGHVKIANDLMEDICKLPISGTGFRILFWALRNSYGYNRKHTRQTTIREICKEVDIKSTAAVCYALRNLLDKKILIKSDSGEFFFDKHKVLSVLKTEQAFSKLNSQPVLKTEQLVLKTEQLVLKTEQAECNIKKDNLKDNLKDTGSTRAPFSVPTLSQISEYCTTRKNSVNPELFFDHYESNGWMVGRNKMRNWQAAVRYWEKNGVNQAQKPAAKGCAPVPGKYAGKEVRV